jgi:sugar phosphate isomerase/epimerase
MASPKFAAGLWVFGQTNDRFCGGGYGPPVSLEEQVRRAAQVPNLKGIEVHQTDFDEMSYDDFNALLRETGLICTLVNTNVWSTPKWKHGAFTHRDAGIRKDAIAEGKRAVDAARALHCPGVGFWLGSDGYDYPFQNDYRKQWEYLVEGIGECARYAAPDIKIGVEYKLKEPRNHISIGDVGKALWLVTEIGADNLGVAVDFGHAMMARELPGDSMALLARKQKLYNVHFNDCFREWDDDMVPGTVHFWETLEFLYYCKVCQYQGWFGLDMFPYREDGVKAADMALRNLQAMWDMVEHIPVGELEKAQETMDALTTQEVVRTVIFK